MLGNKLAAYLVLMCVVGALADDSRSIFGNLLGEHVLHEDHEEVPFEMIFTQPKHHWALPVGKPAARGSMFCSKGTVCGASGKCKTTCQGNCCKLTKQSSEETQKILGAFMNPLTDRGAIRRPKKRLLRSAFRKLRRPIGSTGLSIPFGSIRFDKQTATKPKPNLTALFRSMLTPLNNLLGSDWLRPPQPKRPIENDKTDDFLHDWLEPSSMEKWFEPMHFELGNARPLHFGFSLEEPKSKTDAATTQAATCIRSMSCMKGLCKQNCKGSCCGSLKPPAHDPRAQPAVRTTKSPASSARTASPSKASVETASPTSAVIKTASPSKASVKTASPTSAVIKTASPSKASVKTASPTTAAVIERSMQAVDSRFIAYAALKAKKMCSKKLKDDTNRLIECENRAMQLLQLARQAEM